jgi:hypothetical protein
MNLKGNSGCSIELRGDKIYKSSFSDPSHYRLAENIDRQREFWENLQTETIRCPEVFEMDVPFYVMEYIDSPNLLNQIEHIPCDELHKVADILVGFVKSNVGEPFRLESQVVKEKYTRIKEENPWLKFPPGWDSFIEEKSKNLIIPRGYSHNDLTLSNAIYKDGKIYLLDFLNSYLVSPIQDVSKLFQECRQFVKLDGGVYQGIQRDRLNLLANLLHVGFSEYDWYRSHYNLFAALDMMRILRYTRDEDVRFSVASKIQGLVESS